MKALNSGSYTDNIAIQNWLHISPKLFAALHDHPGLEQDEANVQQFNVQKYVLQDGDIMWQVEFFADEGEDGECLPMLSGEAAQSVFDGDYDEIEIRQEWQEENTLHEWDEGEFQLEPPLDTEEGRTAADEWDER